MISVLPEIQKGYADNMLYRLIWYGPSILENFTKTHMLFLLRVWHTIKLSHLLIAPVQTPQRSPGCIRLCSAAAVCRPDSALTPNTGA
jgi:hypothetical protein